MKGPTVDGHAEIARRRLHNLRLAGSPPRSPQEVVSRLGAMQSQDYGPAKWAVAQRAAGFPDDAVERAVADGSILRTHVLRPTWHFVAPKDIRSWLAVTAPRIQAQNSHRYRQLELSEPDLVRSLEVIESSLAGGKELTRAELRAAFESGGVDTEGQRLPYLLMNAELNAVICSGARRGKQQTFALLRERVPDAPALSADGALGELTLRYFTSHGPATTKDFQWWATLTAVTVRRGLELAEDRLAAEVVDGVTFYSGTEAASARESPTVHLLQTYDEYIVGYRESRFVIDSSGIARARDEQGLFFNPAVVVDGQLAGRWKRSLKKDKVEVEVMLYRPLRRREEDALGAAAETFGEFLGLPVDLRVA